MVSPNNLWQQILAALELEIDPVVISTWFRNTKLFETTEDKLIIACTDAYSKNIIQRKYAQKITEIANGLQKKKFKLEFIVKAPRVQSPVKGPLFDEHPSPSKKEDDQSPNQRSVSTQNTNQLNEQYTLDNFVVGVSNRVVHAAAVSVVENPGQAYNPLLIYGSTGVGKTHLLHAIGNSITQKKPSLKVLYAPAEKFVNDLIEHIRQKKPMRLLRKIYRTCHVLLIDDIQFLAGKESSQEEFYHTFNELYRTNNQLVIASDREPSQIKGLADRLISRFKGGLMVMISPPDYETRLAIAKTKAEELNLNFPELIYQYIAEKTNHNIREIQGIILQIKSITATQNQPINLAVVRSIIEPQYSTPTVTKRLTPELVFDLVTSRFDTNIKDLCGKRRKKEIVIPRQMTMFLLRNELGMNFEEIGEILGGRDHSTIIYGCEKIRFLIEDQDNTLLKSHLSALRQELYS